MTPKDGDGPEIYIPRPERGGDATSVYYFGTKGEAKPPPIVFEEKSRKASGSRSASAGPSAEKNKNSGAADPEDGGLYRESVVTRPDGSKVTVLRPKNRTSRSGGAGAPKREAKKPRKPFSGTRMIEIPRGTLY